MALEENKAHRGTKPLARPRPKRKLFQKDTNLNKQETHHMDEHHVRVFLGILFKRGSNELARATPLSTERKIVKIQRSNDNKKNKKKKKKKTK